MHQLWIKEATFDAIRQKLNNNDSLDPDQCQKRNKSALSEMQCFANYNQYSLSVASS